jgi:RNA polymerase sigma factor (sigma-70 family)
MATGQVNRIVHQLRWLAYGGAERAHPDGQLLERFIRRQDEAAFEELVRRHGPMVLGVCRRLLGNTHDAEDAFQATFMVLVRRARAVRPRDLVGNWLHGVACRVALSAQARSSRLRAREKQVLDMPHPTTTPVDAAEDLRPVLDLELSRLPEKYRTAIVLCELEGRSRKDVARQLGVPEGTLSSRLAAGRKMLAARLAQRGLLVSGAALSAALVEGASQAAVPAILATTTVKAAVSGAASQAAALGLLSARALALTEGAMHAMLISKLKSMASVVLAIGLFTGGAGMMTLTADEAQPEKAGAGGHKLSSVHAQAGPAVGAREVYGALDGDGVLEVFLVPSTTPPRKVILVDGDEPMKRQALHESYHRLAQLHAKQAQGPDPHASVDFDGWLHRLHVNSKYAGRCTACHTPKDVHWREDTPWLPRALSVQESGDGEILVIRLPKTSTPATDAEFLRRVCLDVLGRLPTPLETSYFIKDRDRQKYRRIVEQLAGSAEGAQAAREPNTSKVAPAEKNDRASRAEAYVREKLNKKQLTPEERQLIQKVLEFVAREHGATGARQDAIDNAIINLFELHRQQSAPPKGKGN